MLSPRDSQITSKPDAGTDDTVPDDALEIKWEFDEDSRRYYVSFPDDQQWCLVGAIGTVSHVGVDLLFWYHSRTMSVLDDCNVIHVFV